MCDVYSIEHNILQIHNDKHRIDNMVQIDSRLYTVSLSYSIEIRQLNYCEKGKMFYTRHVVYQMYENDIRLRPCMFYMTK